MSIDSVLEGWATEEERTLCARLVEAGQEHLFVGWASGAADAEKKRAFCAQVRALEANYPGGVVAYSRNARELLRISAAGENPFEGMRPEMPDLTKLAYGTPAFSAMEERGLLLVRDCAFVLVAGGLGERLGYSDIKISLPVQSITEQSYIDLYVSQILSMQAASNASAGAGAAPRTVPLAIMTSDDTHARTVTELAKNGNFGAADGQITLIKQEKVAALVDNAAHFARLGLEGGSGEDVYAIDTKPHGHGDVHTLLASSGLVAAWRAEGRKYVIFFQDTNALCFTVTIAALGVSQANSLEVNSLTVPRVAKDAVGAITRLVRPDGSSMTVNVEYNQLEPMLKASGYPEGDVNGPDGFSPFPGNINQLIFSIPEYDDVLKRTGGLVPEFVNPKYADASKTRFKKPARLECMMQEHPKVLGPHARVGATQFDDWTYSPVKNAVEDALLKARAGVPGRSAIEGEFEYYEAASHALRAAGVVLPSPPPASFECLGFKLHDPPHIVFHPSFAVSFKTFASKFPNPSAIHISSRSTLVVRGGGITFEALNLDGALTISAVPGAKVTVRKLSVSNAGWKFVPLSPEAAASAPDWVRIRGFTVHREGARELTFDAPGEYVVDEA